MALHKPPLEVPFINMNTGHVTEPWAKWLIITQRDKANRVEDGTENNIATLDEDGHPQDSASAIGDISDIVDNFAELVETKIVATDGAGKLTEVDLSDWISGTAGKITVTDDGDGTVTLNVTLKADSGLTFDANGIYAKLKTGFGIAVDSDGLQLNQQVNIVDASESHTITDPADAPATADALRDDLVLNAIPDVEAALNALGVKVNAILALLLASEMMAGP